MLLSVPHAGRAYSQALLHMARVPVSALAVLEDPLVDRLVGRGIAAGAAAIIAHAPRAEIDLNRSLDDLDPSMVSSALPGTSISRRASAGLGLIPSRLAGHGDIWRRSLPADEVHRRIEHIHHPFHEALSVRLRSLRDQFGVAVLLDCHSMPSQGPAAPPLVLGDRHGTSSDEALLGAAEAACGEFGVRSVRNDPYAGGAIVARHGRPADNVHAIQIEVDRSFYLAPDMRSPGPGFDQASRLIAAIVMAVAEAATPHSVMLAAE